jgi:hypothetical protein
MTLRLLAKELTDRCGGYHAVHRAHGIREETIRLIVLGQTERMQKRTAARILLALSEQRKYDRRNGSSKRFLEARMAQARIEERIDRDGCG